MQHLDPIGSTILRSCCLFVDFPFGIYSGSHPGSCSAI